VLERGAGSGERARSLDDAVAETGAGRGASSMIQGSSRITNILATIHAGPFDERRWTADPALGARKKRMASTSKDPWVGMEGGLWGGAGSGHIPERGAWNLGIRRMRRERRMLEHEEQIDGIGWPARGRNDPGTGGAPTQNEQDPLSLATPFRHLAGLFRPRDVDKRHRDSRVRHGPPWWAALREGLAGEKHASRPVHGSAGIPAPHGLWPQQKAGPNRSRRLRR